MYFKIKKDDSEYISGVIFFVEVTPSKLEVDTSFIHCELSSIQLGLLSIHCEWLSTRLGLLTTHSELSSIRLEMDTIPPDKDTRNYGESQYK